MKTASILNALHYALVFIGLCSLARASDDEVVAITAFHLKDGTTVEALRFLACEGTDGTKYIITTLDMRRRELSDATVIGQHKVQRKLADLPQDAQQDISLRKQTAAKVAAQISAADETAKQKEAKKTAVLRSMRHAADSHANARAAAERAGTSLREAQAALKAIDDMIVVLDAKIEGLRSQYVMRFDGYSGRQLELERALIDRARLRSQRQPIADEVFRANEKAADANEKERIAKNELDRSRSNIPDVYSDSKPSENQKASETVNDSLKVPGLPPKKVKTAAPDDKVEPERQPVKAPEPRHTIMDE